MYYTLLIYLSNQIHYCDEIEKNFNNPPIVSKYISQIGLAKMCDFPGSEFLSDWKNAMRCHLSDYSNIKKPSIIWVNNRPFEIRQFYLNVLPKIQHKFILVTNMSDYSIPFDLNFKQVNKLLKDPRLIHWFTQNYFPLKHSDQLSPIPIGLNFHLLECEACEWGPITSMAKQEKDLDFLISELKPTHQRKPRILIDWHLHETTLLNQPDRPTPLREVTKETRTSILQKIKSKTFIDLLPNKMPRTQLWATKGKYAFSMSPPGNGLDCFRTWEDLVLGLIVIVKTSTIDSLFEGLPVVIVNDWDEITQENLDKWLVQYADAFTNPEYRKKLTNEYWFSKIRNKLKEHL